MLGITEEVEKKHPKLVIGISGAAVLSIFIMGGQLTLNYGRMMERVDASERRDVQYEALLQRIEEQRVEEHRNFIQRNEYVANNQAVLRELQSTQAAIRDLTRQVARVADQEQGN